MLLALIINVLCVFLMMLPGLVARRMGAISKNGAWDLSYLLVTYIYPSLIFSSIFSKYSLSQLAKSWELPVGCFLLIAIGWGIGWLTALVTRFPSAGERHAYMFQCSLNNYSFLPLPLVAALFGENGVAALILSTLGAEVALWTIGVMSISGGKFNRRDLRHLLSPSLLAIYLAITARALCDAGGVTGYVLAPSHPNAVSYLFNAIKLFGAATVPIAMTIAGCRIGALQPKGFNNPRIWVVTFLRLVVIPVIALLVLSWLPFTNLGWNVICVVAVMPVALASFMFSELYGGDKDFITCSVITTHLGALVSVPALLAFFI